MTAPQDFSELINKGTDAQARVYSIWKDGMAEASTTVGRWHSLWGGAVSARWAGNPRSGAVPTTVEAPTNATEGSLKQADATGGRKLWLTGGWLFGGPALGAARVYDRVLHIGGFSGTSTSAQTVGGTLTRHTGGEGNCICAEIYGVIGTTPTTITASYTNQAGTSGRTTQAVTIGGTSYREVFKMIPLPLQSGDTGVQAVASATLLATTGTAGNFGITVTHPYITTPQNRGPSMFEFAFRTEGYQEVEPGACVAFAYLGQIQSSSFLGQLNMVEQ